MSAKCRGCGEEGARGKDWCDVCLLLVPIITGESPDSIAADPAVEEIRASMGGAGTETRKIWSAVRKLPDSSSTSWILKENAGPITLDVGLPLRNWSLEEDDLRLLDVNFRDQKDPSCTSEENHQLRRLQRGGYLPVSYTHLRAHET